MVARITYKLAYFLDTFAVFELFYVFDTFDRFTVLTFLIPPRAPKNSR